MSIFVLLIEILYPFFVYILAKHITANLKELKELK